MGYSRSSVTRIRWTASDPGRVPTGRTGDLDELRVRATGVLEQGLGAGVDMELCPIDDLLATASSVAKFSRVVKA